MAVEERFGKGGLSISHPTLDAGYSPESISEAGQAIDFLTAKRDFHIRLSTSGPRRVAEHSHDTIQISIPLGSTIASVAWRKRSGALQHAVARRGHVLIIPPRQRHAVAWKNRARFVNIHLSAMTTADARQEFLRRVARLGEAHVIGDPFLSRLGEIIVLQAAKEGGLDDAALQSFRTIIEMHVMHPYGDPPAGITGSQPVSDPAHAAGSGLARSALRKVTAAIQRDLGRDWTVEELAGIAGLSAGHFSRGFRRSIGAPPRQWIIQQRIDAAMDRLLMTQEPLSEIAIAVGFAEQAHFTRTFTRLIGTSPGAWRRRHQA